MHESKFSEVRVGASFLYNKTRFMKLPPNLFKKEEGQEETINVFQEGGGQGVGEAKFISEDSVVHEFG